MSDSLLPFIMKWASFFFFLIAAVVHIYFFVLESFLFQKPEGYKLFKMPQENHNAVKPWAFNQGFYNLMLALGTLKGLHFVLQKQVMQAGLITGFCGASMILAGLALWYSVPKMRKAALIQIIPPLLGFVFLSFHIFRSI